jgi:hypothetical protein
VGDADCRHARHDRGYKTIVIGDGGECAVVKHDQAASKGSPGDPDAMSAWPFRIKRSSPVGLDKTVTGLDSAAAVRSKDSVLHLRQSGTPIAPRAAGRLSQWQQINISGGEGLSITGQLPDVASCPLRWRIHSHLRGALLFKAHVFVTGDFPRRRLAFTVGLAELRPALAGKLIDDLFERLDVLRCDKHLLDRAAELTTERAVRPGLHRIDPLRRHSAELRNLSGARGVDFGGLRNPLGCVDAEKIRKRALIHSACERQFSGVREHRIVFVEFKFDVAGRFEIRWHFQFIAFGAGRQRQLPRIFSALTLHNFFEFVGADFDVADLNFLGAGRLLLLLVLLVALLLIARLSSGRFASVARWTMAPRIRIFGRPLLLLVLGLPVELVEGLAVASRRRTARLLAAARL